MKVKSALLFSVIGCAVVIPLSLTFVHLNFSFHRRSWEKSRIEGQREEAHSNLSTAATFYQLAMQDVDRFPCSDLMRATTYAEGAEIFERQKDFANARKFYERALSLSPPSPDSSWLPVKFACLSGLGRVVLAQGQPDAAEPILKSAIAAYSNLTSVGGRTTDNLIAGDQQIHDLLSLASIYSNREDSATATLFVQKTADLLTSFPLEADSRHLLTRLSLKYKVVPGDHSEVSDL